jgi:predicted CopG family antitoxin
MSEKTLKISETAHKRLTDYKAEFGHKSFDSAIRELIAENKRLHAQENNE